MTGITVSQAGDHLVAVKHGHDPDRRARLRHEADLLGRLDHPGVVRLVDFQEGPPAALRTAFVGPDSWRTTSASPAEFAALTATIADLHDSGVVHGDLTPDHVLLDRDHRPILCGFADAGPATDERVRADREALAAMLRHEAGRHGNGVGHRLRDAADVLDEPDLPTRAAIRLLDQQAPPDDHTRSGPSRRHAMVVVCVVAAALVAFLLADGDGDGPTPALAPTPTAEPPGTAPGPVSPTPAPADLIPAGPGDPATVVEHAGRRYGIGAAGDLVHIADWDCTGEATPAVLRPTTGELAVFSSWPEPDASLLPTMTMVVEGAIGFTIDDRPCPDLRVRTQNGSRLVEVPT